MCVKCSVYDSLQSEPSFDEDERSTAYCNSFCDSTYEPPSIDSTYCDEGEENRDATADSTGGTLTEPCWRSPCSIFLKLRAILPLERQPIPVAQQ